MTNTKITLPKINLNGTSPETLYDEYNWAAIFVRKTMQSITAATFHGRDFQGNHPDDFNQAQFERAEILAKLDDALDYCMAWMENANEAIESRETKS
jgi:hypothetical protein